MKRCTRTRALAVPYLEKRPRMVKDLVPLLAKYIYTDGHFFVLVTVACYFKS